MTGKAEAKVFTIPSGIPFVDALAAGLLAQAGGDPLALSRMSVLLPNRRACRALQEAFLRLGVMNGGAILLPRLQPIGEVDEDDLAVLGAGADALDIPPAISVLRRQMLLARLVRKQSESMPRETGGEMRFDQALRLAADLARLIDQVETERLDFARIANLVSQDFAEHWQITVRFLDILREAWPGILANEDCIDPASRRNLLIERQCARWRAHPPRDPVIAAGSTGSIPASADLIAVVSRLPQGAVVLPGLDRDADAAAWTVIAEDPGHPQFGLAQLLRRLEIAPEDVRDWPSAGAAASPATRRRIVSHALLPAGETTHWPKLAKAMNRETAELAWRQVRRIDCHTEQEEAGIIALLLRQAAERGPGFRAALVTPDRGLARRVAAELARWQIAIDDSAGQPLSLTAPGAFLVLIAEAAASDWAPGPLLALLKHPLAAGGRSPSIFRARVRALERLALRGLRPAPGIAGVAAAVAEAARRTGDDPDFRKEVDASLGFVAELQALFADFHDWRRPKPLTDRLDIHLRLAEALAAPEISGDAETGAGNLWRGEAGEALAEFASGLLRAGIDMPATDAGSYAALISELMAGEAVRPRYGLHPRLFIWGPLEARLQQADFVVLGGLNEGAWPAETAIDPWLNRPMRREFGLPSPERKIGLSAHDFQQAMGTAEVVLTRSLRVGGAPTVPSRWLLRLDAFLQCLGLVYDVGEASAYRGWQRRLDRRDPVQAVGRPNPRPGAKYRPRSLSVTQIETWMRDPYAIYARAILKLRALDPLDQDPGAADLGSYIHAALDKFMRQFPKQLPPDAADRLLQIGRGIFAAELDRPAVWAFWWPRFERIAAWFVANEAERRSLLEASHTECKGEWAIDGFTPPFKLTGKADRIDRMVGGGLTIVDYKTGGVPASSDVALGFAPQLPLEAAMARSGGFGDALKDRIAGLEYWRLTGGDPAGEVKPIKESGTKAIADPAQLADDAYRGLMRLLQVYSRDDAAYPAVPQPNYAPGYSDYRHLARIGEWSTTEDGEG